MVTRHGAKKFIISSLDEIKKRIEAGYTIKEIHLDLPDLNNNISYSSTLRNLQKMGISEKTPHPTRTLKTKELETKSKLQEEKEMTNVERNRAKFENRSEPFSYDPHTTGKDLI